MPSLYGSDIEGVRSHVPQLSRLDETSKPSTTDVARYIETLERWVQARVGRLDSGANKDDDAKAHAKGLVELGAASWTYDAAYPERVGKTEQSYGEMLWTRFLLGIDELLEARGLDTGGGEAPVNPDGPAFYAPEPLIRRDVGF